MTAVRRDGTDWLLDVRVQPRAARTEFAGLRGERLRIRLHAPPVDGRANSALCEFLADACDLPKSRVTLERGVTGRDKCVRLHGLPALPQALLRALGDATA
ncbi:MAG TPA: DUF167 family protein [Steroidobacteraceae bacterium]